MDCQSGDTLAAAQAESTDRSKVLKALAEAANKLRGELGESLGSVERFKQPLEEATTSSLDALQAYTQGRKKQAEREKPRPFPISSLPSIWTQTSPTPMSLWQPHTTIFTNIAKRRKTSRRLSICGSGSARASALPSRVTTTIG